MTVSMSRAIPLFQIPGITNGLNRENLSPFPYPTYYTANLLTLTANVPELIQTRSSISTSFPMFAYLSIEILWLQSVPSFSRG